MIREAQLVFRSYETDTITKDSLFLYFVYPIGWQVFKPEKAPLDSEQYIAQHGFPVKMWIVDQGNPNLPQEEEVLASPDQIGWIDEGDHTDELMDIEVRHINHILDRYDGWIHIETDDDGEPILFMDKVTISYADDIDDEWLDDDDDEYINDEPWYEEDDEGPETDGAGFTDKDR